jgi:solute:Na+ symporter, SSS family
MPPAENVLSAADYAVVLLYLGGTVVLGVLIGRKTKTGDDFFLAGRRLPWWAIGMSLVATDIGGTDIIGVGGAANRFGIAVANFEWIGCVPAMIIGAFVFIPFFYRTGVYTVPEFLERRYNAGVRSVMAVCWLTFMACNLGIMLLASGKMMSSLFGWDQNLCILITAGMVGFYTCVGGLAAVVYTDMIQCVVMIAGCLAILVLGIVRVGGVTELRDQIEAAQVTARQPIDAEADTISATASGGPSASEKTSLILPVDTASPFPWPGILFGLAMILSPAYWIGNQAIVQRSLGARSEFEAKASYVWGALLKNLIPLIIAVPGLIAIVLIPDLDDSDMAIPQLVGELFPSGLRGLFVAAFLAALMSSIDSYLNSAATIVAHDLYKRFVNPQVSGEKMLKIGRVVTTCLVTWAIAFAFLLAQIGTDSGLYAIFQTLMAFFQGPAFAILVIGIFWKRATGRAALISLLAGIATSIGLFTLNQPAVYNKLNWAPLFRIQEPFLYFSIWAFLVTAVLLVLISLCGPPDDEDKSAYVLSRRRRETKTT